MSYLSFISDENLKQEISTILSTAATALEDAGTEFESNVIDPFSIVFEMAGFNIKEVVSWEVTEKARQSQKTLSNAFGNFHQNILGHVYGWENLGIGKSVDLVCHDRKIIAEIKNKYSTVTGGKLTDLYSHLDGLVMPIVSMYKGYTSYYVETIPRPKRSKPQNYDVPFTPSDKATKTRRSSNELIRQIDGQSFYALVTGVPDALEQLYDVIPAVIGEASTYSFPPKELAIMKTYFKKAFV